jgi:hypothetical protein
LSTKAKGTSSVSVTELLHKYGWKFFAVYYGIYLPTLALCVFVTNQELVTENNVDYILSSAGVLDEAEEITAENKYKILAKSAGIGNFVDLDEVEISPVVGSIVVGYALAQLTEPVRLPLCIAITARIASRAA